jgi:HPt (histidine-containing phosphotransfer) domain-containing protein
MEPGMSGSDAAKNIRSYELEHKLKYKTPIIAVAGDNNQNLVYEFFRSGIDDCHKKGDSNANHLDRIMAFWVIERSNKKNHNELLHECHFNPKTDILIECQYYNNDYDNIELVNNKICPQELLEIIDLFIKTGSHLIEKIIRCYEKGDVKGFGVHVHSLKGVAGNMGLERLYRLSHNLNEASKEVDVITDACMEKLKDIFDKTKEVLEKLNDK